MCVEDENKEYNPKGIVVKKNERDTRKTRPFPLTTVDLTKQGIYKYMFYLIECFY